MGKEELFTVVTCVVTGTIILTFHYINLISKDLFNILLELRRFNDNYILANERKSIKANQQ